MSFNLATMLRESALEWPDKGAIIAGATTISYAELDGLSGRLAATLLADGYPRRSAVAVQLPNVPQFLIAYFGLLKAGMTMVPLNPLLVAPEVTYHLEDSDAVALITWESFAAEAAKGAQAVPAVTTYVVNAPGSDARPEGTQPFAALLRQPDDGDIHPTSADDTAVLLYTSGTTGRPKGAMLTHFQLFMNCTVAGGLFGVRKDDITLAVLPLFHVFGLSSVLNVSVRYGGTLSLVPRFEAAAVLDTIERDRATVFLGVPTMFFALLAEDIEGRNLACLRIACSGGAPIPGEVIRGWEAKYGVIILEGYGLSESASTATFNVSAEERKVLSIGKRIWGVEVRIADDLDRPLPAGEEHVGEILLRGHNITKGYYKKPEETAAAFRSGWFHTGDLAYADAEGFIFIVDRKKDLIIRGGYNVYPREVEEVLYTHPAVAEAAVIGRPDDRLGEEVLAYVSLKPGAAADPTQIIEFCKERVAAYKYPREVRIIAELPKGPTGKILKKDLDR
jgi:long-chain acyl-CoA synthetase